MSAPFSQNSLAIVATGYGAESASNIAYLVSAMLRTCIAASANDDMGDLFKLRDGSTDNGVRDTLLVAQALNGQMIELLETRGASDNG